MSFTAHNIRFQDGMMTMPDNPRLLADEPRCLSAKQIISLIYGANVQNKRIADLACLEGGYALEFARMGMDALGVEIRQSNINNCRDVQERAGLPNLDFIQDDVWNIRKYAPFDVVFCSGILYHLDRPREFIRLMGEVARDAVIINTHYAPWNDEFVFTLSGIEEHEGLIGRWFYEHDLNDPTSLNALKWSSWTNHRSFWLTKEALVQAMHDANFDIILEQFDAAAETDFFGEMTSKSYKALHRAAFVGIRSPQPPAWGQGASRRRNDADHA